MNNGDPDATIRTPRGYDMDVVGSIAPGPGRTSDDAKQKLRTDADIESHYRVEVELAGRLRAAPRAERQPAFKNGCHSSYGRRVTSRICVAVDQRGW